MKKIMKCEKRYTQLKKATTFSAVLMLLGFIFNSIGLQAESEETISGLTAEKQIQQLFDKGWTFMGQMHKDMANLDRTVEVYKKVLLIDPENEDAYWRLAEVTFKKADEEKDDEKRKKLYQKTIEYSKKSVKLNPNSAEAHYWIGCSSARLAELEGILSAIGLVSNAKTELLESIKIDSNNRFAILARVVLAAIYSETPWPLNNFEKAEIYAIEAVKLDPNLTIASKNLGKIYIEMDNFTKARVELKRCLSIKDPTYVWDSVLYDWPAAKRFLKEIESQ